MKQLLLLIAFVVLTSALAFGQPTDIIKTNTALEQEIGKVLRDAYDALSRRDAAVINLFADNALFYSLEAGYTNSVEVKEGLRSYFKSPAAANSKESFEIEDLKVVSASGDTVIANYGLVTKTDRGGKTDVRRERYTNVFVRRDGRWQLVAEHSSRMPKPIEPVVAGMPIGWIKTPLGTGDRYSMTVDANVKRSGKASASVKFNCGEESGSWGSLAQSIAADDYRGKRIRLTGWLKTENVDSAGLWMRLDGSSRQFGFDNMQNRAVKGTTDWKQYEVVLDVPNETVNIFFGTLVEGKGQVWVDDLKLEIVGQNVPVTNMLSSEDMKRDLPYLAKEKKSEAKQPMNPGFENGTVQ